MIVNENQDDYKIVTQHDHAHISFEIAKHWRKSFFALSERKSETLYAIRHHDRAWIPLDSQLLWNDKLERPYNFTDYPLEKKLLAYGKGIQEVEQETRYGALLCSEHYASFFSKSDTEDEIQLFLQQERQRQQSLRQALNLERTNSNKKFHFDLLQFCDNLSLYMCIQEPGVSKKQEISWFRNGFPQKFEFAPEGMMARWLDVERIEIDPYPFELPFHVSIPFSTLRKKDIKEKGLQTAWKEGSRQSNKVYFVPK